MTDLAVPAHHPRHHPASPPSSSSGATIEVRPVDAAHGVIVTVSGPLALDGADALSRQLDAELDRRRHVVVLDLSAVPSCDPAGVEVLAQARERARREGVSLHLVHLGAPAARAWLAGAGLT